MRDALVGLLDKTDLALASCQNVVSDEALESFAETARDVRVRLDYPADLVVTALAGGTGSGKSSILNAIAGEEVADVGGVRPTTNTALAVLAPNRVGVIDGYLRELDIKIRPVSGIPEWLVLIDLPDTDSVDVEHRFQVETLLPHVDVLVWVTDPEKYRDAVLHDRFLKPLAVYERQMQFVLNQADRLADGSVEEVLADFAAALSEDGIDDPQPLATSANPTSGPPGGIDDLLSALATLIGSGADVYRKLMTDLERAVAVMETHVGMVGVEFERRFSETIDKASASIVDDEGDAASLTLTRFVEDLATETGGPVGEEIRAVAVDVPTLVHTTRESLTTALLDHRKALPLIRWSVKGDSMPRELRLDLVTHELETTLEPPLRHALSRRANARAALTDLSLSLASTRSGPL